MTRWRAPSPATSASTFPAARPSWCATCRAPAASRRQTISIPAPSMTAPSSAVVSEQPAARAAVRHQGGALRPDQVQLARLAERRDRHGAGLACGAGEFGRRPAQARNRDGRVRRQLDAGLLRARAQRDARNQDKGHSRLSRPERRLPRHGTRRARRLSERVLQRAVVDAADLARREEGQGHRAVWPGEDEGTRRRAVRARSRHRARTTSCCCRSPPRRSRSGGRF